MLHCTLGSPCAAKVVRRRSNGYEAMVAAAPAKAPLPKDTADERAWSEPDKVDMELTSLGEYAAW